MGAHAARLVDAQAVDLGTEVEQAVDAGRPHHLEIQQRLGVQPARDHRLLADVEHQLVSAQARIRRTHRILHVPAADLEQTGIDAELVSGLDIAHHGDCVCTYRDAVGELGLEVKVADLLVLDVADVHHHIGQRGVSLAMTDVDAGETVGQRRQVTHAEFHPAGRSVDREVHAVSRLRRRTQAIPLGCRHRPDAELATATDPVVARSEVDVVSHQRDALACTTGFDHAAVKRQQGLGSRELNIDLAGLRIQTAIDQVQAVELSHDHIGVQRVGAEVDHRQPGQFGVEHTRDAMCAEAESPVRRQELGLRHIEQTRRVEDQARAMPAGAIDHRQHRLGGGIAEFDAIDTVVEVDGSLFVECGVDDELSLVELDRQRREPVDHDTVVARAADQVDHAVGADIDQVVSGTRIDGVHRAAERDEVSTTARRDLVDASAHVDDLGTFAAGELVGVRAAEIPDAVGVTADKLVLARAAANNAASSAAQNHEVVVAVAAIEVQHRRHASADIDEVDALAAVADDLLDLRRVISVGHTERPDDDLAVGGLLDVVRLVDGVVEYRALPVAA